MSTHPHHNRFIRGMPLALRLAAAAAIVLASWGGASTQVAPALLDPLTHPKFVNPVPNPLTPGFIFQPDGTVPGPGGDEAYYQVGIFEIQQSLGLVDALGTPLVTRVWGYGKDKASATYPGRSFVERKDRPVNVLWTNNLVDDMGQPLAHFLPVDETIHWAMPLDPPYPYSGVPAVTHLHGGHSESASDGLPESWFTPDFAQTGPTWRKRILHYDNDQPAATLWYHDHALGITRLNVYAGLAGFYILRDEVDTGAPDNPLRLPAYPYEVPLVIQDRMFTADGQLYYPAEPEEEGQPAPSILPEFFGDFILVNGQAWPYLDVEPRKYRLRWLNGSDSRFYDLYFGFASPTAIGMGPQFNVIGTDQGFLYAPAVLDRLTIGPGERVDSIIDFSAFAGQTLILRNNARAPFPGGDTINPNTVGQIMAFRVAAGPVSDPSVIPATLLPTPIERLIKTGETRKLLLFEGEDEYGRLEPMLGTIRDGTFHFMDPITENPMLDDVEVWEIFNATEDAHPIHLHLVAFQVINRQRFRAHVDHQTGALSNVRVFRRARGPGADEAGWKDTVRTFPGQVTRVIAKFDRAGLYVWHCHILSHEDHDMMRPYCVGDMSGCTSPMP